jgi:2-polyprenyl-6-hydroxyphenyl methylase/3-demethylubiquinone-9 3-methyltransferase
MPGACYITPAGSGRLSRTPADWSRGFLFVSIYNDQGRKRKRWRKIKRRYNSFTAGLRTPYALLVSAPSEISRLHKKLMRGRLRSYVRSWTEPGPRRMSRWHDLLDWVGGYPSEVAKPEEIFRFCRDRGFELRKLTNAGGGLGCNEFVFVHSAGDRRPRPAS